MVAVVFGALATVGAYLISERGAAPGPAPSGSGPPTAARPVPRASTSAVGDLLPEGHEDATWEGAHAESSTEGCATCHPLKRCEACHGVELPHPILWNVTHGRAALAAGATCSKCHRDVRKDCTSCHRTEMPHPAGWIEKHRPLAAKDTASCARCHEKRDCATCHELNTVKSCATCHEEKVKALDKEGGHATSKCLTCHADEPGVIGPGKDHRRTPSCISCHGAKRLVADQKPQSQRDWLTTAGAGEGAWTERGKHAEADLTRCAWCHVTHDTATPRYPPGVKPDSGDCASSCHSVVGGSVVSRGFTNASGDPEATTYRGTLRPGELLAEGGTAHSRSIFPQTGCAGRCHQGPHGAITTCTSCHSYGWAEAENLHDTHIPFVGAEQQQADPGNFVPGRDDGACMYCHERAEDPGREVYRRSCWNCHLSGHDPVTPYWEMPSG